MARYPMKEKHGAFGVYYEEMTADEYCEELARYECSMPRYLESKYRRDREYGSYLRRWFSNEQCDGTADVFERFERKLLPMSFNVYWMG